MTISDAEFDNLMGRLDDCYGVHLGHASRPIRVDNLGLGRWITDYVSLRADGRDHEAAFLEVERRIHLIAFPPPAPAPIPPGQSVRPLTGYLRLLGKSFADDTGPRRVQFCSYFAFFRIFRDDPDEAKRQLDRIKGHWQGLRVCWNLGGNPWDGHHLNVSPDWPDYDRVIVDGLTACWDRGLRVAITNADLYHRPEADWPGLYRRVAGLCASVNDQVVALSSVINESWMTSPFGEDWPRYAEYARQWQSVYPWGQHGTSCPSTNEDPEGLIACSLGPATVTLLQGTRWTGPDAIRRAFNVRFEAPSGFKPIVEEEPTGFDSDGDHAVYQPTTDKDTLLGIYTMKVLTGQLLILLNGPALYNRKPLDSTWGFTEIPAIWQQMELPDDTGQWTLKPLHHNDSPCTGSGLARLDGVTNGSQYFAVASGGRDWTLGPSRWDALATVYDHTGPILERQVHAGETITQLPGQPTPKVVRLLR